MCLVKITSVDVFHITNTGQLIKELPWNPVVVRVNTDEGISGFGEVGLAYGVGYRGGFGAAQDLAKLLIGKDPMKAESLWESMFRDTFWGAGGGPCIYGGMSALDIALWDIKGKALGVPVYQLLGGKSNNDLRAYASQLQFGWELEKKTLTEPEQYAEVTKQVMEEGYDSIKVDPIVFDHSGNWAHPDWKMRGLLEYDVFKTAYDRVKAMREAGGPELDIIIELHSFTDTNTAIQLGQALEEFNIFYYEEPVHPMNVESMVQVAHNVNIPIASGERIYTRFGYREFLEKRALHVIQPDMCLAGGFTEVKKICDMAHVYDAGVQIHVCGGPISTAAALQLEAVIPNFLIHEHHAGALRPENINMCTNDYQPKNGYFAVPDQPGIGQELTEQAMKDAFKVTIE